MALTALQWKFIGIRLLAATDKEAAETVGVNPVTVSGWKAESPDFAREYEAAFTDGVHVAQEYTRKLLGKAAQRLDEALDATRTVSAELKVEYFNDEKRRYVNITEPDHKARLEAVKLLFQSQGLLKNQQVHSGDPDNPIQNEMVVTIVRSGGRTRISHTGTTPGAGADSERGEAV